MNKVSKKDKMALVSTIGEMDAELSKAFKVIENWALKHKANGAVVIRCMLHTENRVAVLERTYGKPENLKEIADLIVNDEHDEMYDIIRKVYKHEGDVND